MDIKRYTINGVLKVKNDFWVLNGDIENNIYGEELYIVSTISGDKTRLVRDLPIEVQTYIREHKLIKEK